MAQLPLSREQIHALRVVAETGAGKENILVPRSGFLLMIEMCEMLQSPGCSRCGIALGTDELGPYSYNDTRWPDRKFCTENCLDRWIAVETRASDAAAAQLEPQYVTQRPGYFSGTAKVNVGIALAAAKKESK